MVISVGRRGVRVAGAWLLGCFRVGCFLSDERECEERVERLGGEPLVHLCRLCEPVADDISDILSALVGKEREEICLEVFTQSLFDGLFSQYVIEVLELHRPVSSGLERHPSDKNKEFPECLLDLWNEDVDGLRVVTIEVGLDAFLYEWPSFRDVHG